MTERRTFTVRLSEDAYDTLRTFCVEHGVTATGLIEAFSHLLPSAPEDRSETLVNTARQLDGRRRRRD